MPVRWIRFQGKMDDEAERERVRKTELYRMGDTILVWVNEGDICLEVNMDPTHLDINEENERLKAGIAELRKVWFAGIDLDKEAIAQECLKLFALAAALRR